MADNTLLRFTIDGTTYELDDRLSLGEARILKHEFGMQNLADFDPGDPDQLVGLMYIRLRRDRGDEPSNKLLAEVEALDLGGVDFGGEDEAEDPTPAAPVAAIKPKSSAKKKASSGATTR